MARRREINVFNLSFLDIMSCGFGAVILLFMIINHDAKVRSDTLNENILAEVALLEEEVLEGEKHLVELKDSLRETETAESHARARSGQISTQLQQDKSGLEALLKDVEQKETELAALKASLKAQEKSTEELKSVQVDTEDKGEAVRSFQGEGDRQYLTGLKVGGKNILLLVDASASMLDSTIVNIVRRRNLPDEQKLKAPKWRQAVRTADWITSQFPGDSKFQIYTFNTTAEPLLKGTQKKWIGVKEGNQLDQAIQALQRVVPANGTSLQNAFAEARALSPQPDNIFLITDGLPTQAESRPFSGKVSSEARFKYFQNAVNVLPRGIPVNVILLPIEGDPRAASAYWQLAQISQGSFLTPSADWP